MLYCKDCKCQVVAGYSQRFIGELAISRTGVTVMNVTPKDVSGGVTYYCPECDKERTIADLVSRCLMCGEQFAIADLVTPQNSGGVYCLKDYEDYFADEKLIPTAELVTKLKTRNNR